MNDADVLKYASDAYKQIENGTLPITDEERDILNQQNIDSLNI